MLAVIKGPVEFGLIPPDMWNQPDWIDEERATAGRNKMVNEHVVYGGKYMNSMWYPSSDWVDSQAVYHTATCAASTLVYVYACVQTNLY